MSPFAVFERCDNACEVNEESVSIAASLICIFLILKRTDGLHQYLVSL